VINGSEAESQKGFLRGDLARAVVESAGISMSFGLLP
jgi:hypothetical protein